RGSARCLLPRRHLDALAEGFAPVAGTDRPTATGLALAVDGDLTVGDQVFGHGTVFGHSVEFEQLAVLDRLAADLDRVHQKMSPMSILPPSPPNRPPPSPPSPPCRPPPSPPSPSMSPPPISPPYAPTQPPPMSPNIIAPMRTPGSRPEPA